MPRFPSVWSFPDVPDRAGQTLDQWAAKVVSFLKQLLVVLQLITSAVAIKVNNELMSLAGINNVTGVLNLTNATQLRIPQISGDFAVPNVGEIWYNSALHHIRFDTDNIGIQSLAYIRPLAQNFGLGASVASLNVTLSPAEPDTNYQVLSETTWTTAWSISSKAVGGFTFNFGTATPDANQKITYCLVR